MTRRRRCAVVGTPVAHSLSPVLHRAAYAALGLDWSYGAHELAERDLPDFVDALDEEWRGLSLTMPLKRAVVPLLTDLIEPARAAGAANTLLLDGGRRAGHNTDIPGAAAALRERYDGPVRSAVVLGGGATATSALFALADLGCRHVTLMVRDPTRAGVTVRTAQRHARPPSVEVRPLTSAPVRADVLVSTIPAAAQGADVVRLAEQAGVVFDVIYDPWPTPLARFAQDAARPLVAGLDLLVHQAVLQVELMTGEHPGPLAAMRRAGERALADRSKGRAS